MPIAYAVREALGSSSLIRKMFEEGTALKKQFGAENVYDFSLGNPDVEPPQEFHNVFLALAIEDRKGSHGYMSNAGYPEVREALAKKAAGEQGVALTGEHVIMSVGAAGALNVVLKAILNAGDEVVVSTPYFMEYKAYTANHGGRLVEVEALPDFNLDVDAMAAALMEKTAAVLINSPHNPTGRVYDEKTLRALADALMRHGKKCGRYPYLIADEPYREIVYDGVRVPPVLSAYRESIAVNSYSKSLSLPGERIGYIAVNPALSDVGDMLQALVYTTRVLGYVNAPALMQKIVAALTSVTVDVAVYARRRAAFKDVLDKAGISYAEPDGAFYLFCKVPEKNGETDDAAFVDHLKKYRILGVGGTGFGKPGWVRFAYCVDEAVIKASADGFSHAVAQWKGGK